MQPRLLPLALLGIGAWILYGCGGGMGTGGTGNGGDSGTAGASGAAGTAGPTAGAGGGGAAGAAGTTVTSRGGNGGTTSRGGNGGTTGRGGATAGSAGSAGTSGSAGAPATSSLCTWPTASGTTMVTSTYNVGGMFDGGMKRFVGSGPLGTSSQSEDQNPLFLLSDGATLQNVILGNPAADGVHCAGNCTLKNVWWEDVGEDAATLEGTSPTQVMTIDGGGAQKASDKVFQHNGPGTMVIKNFCAQDFGKLYRSCGNCDTQYTRHVEVQNVMVVPGSSTSALVGVNSNYNDTAKLSSILIKAASNSLTVCQRYTGNNTGAEPPKNGSGADGTVCMYSTSDITWMP
ncbi:MAG TPA: pectate lyase [Polyangia bacterium]